ncbi:RNA-directed DNA polymerase [Nocardia sp. NBC_01730]|uniref:antiviral reverse transcriptase Drt4 n=1 Tax=Nocardia sp. NBC_01730 TaxID=2975998 RepID=UPI002E12334F|nr:RNA-directed DNA polymerase [Nocardia sp. NBC_01730]
MVKLGNLLFNVPNAPQVRDGLLKHNYFPSIAKRRDELPPSIVSTDFTADVANELIQQCSTSKGIRKDYDAVSYEATRFNLVARRLSIPHPLPYARLVNTIADNWTNLRYVATNQKSQFRPAYHGDGRLIAMNYGRQWAHNKIGMKWARFGAEYRVSADVANFYPGFYTHSIPWAIAGHSIAKKNRSPSTWYNELDMRFRDCNRGETVGLHVGPGTSAIGSDIVLTAVDKILETKGYNYTRFVDDYKFYAVDRRDAENFILDLSEALSSFGLKLNGGKTKVEELPIPDRPGWMRALLPQIPQSTHFSRLEPYLEEAMELAKVTPDGSVLKFAVDAVLRTKDLESRADEILPCLFTIAFHTPGLLPEISHIIRESNTTGVQYTDELNSLLRRHARFRRSDGMSWVLHIMREESVPLKDSSIDSVMETGDCIPLVLLHKTGQTEAADAVTNHVNTKLATSPVSYDLDQDWLLYYELFLQGTISNPYSQIAENRAAQEAFECLKERSVSFVK